MFKRSSRVAIAGVAVKRKNAKIERKDEGKMKRG
jgi:hypothetical protein